MNTHFSYSAIHTFTVVAQTLNFSRAAQILNITPSAVSHQMKLLESQLGVTLFARKAKGVILTSAAEVLVKRANIGVSLIKEGVKQSQSNSELPTLHIACIPSLAHSYIVKRLPDFYQLYPGVNIQLYAEHQLIDFNKSHIDGHIHFGRGEYLNLNYEFLSHEFVFPTISPTLIEPEATFDKATFQMLLAKLPVLEYVSGIEDAPGNLTSFDFIERCQLPTSTVLNIRRFSQVILALQAAKLGQGVALSWERIAIDDIQSGQLISNTQLRQQLPFSYYFVSPTNRSNELLNCFSTWLKTMFNTNQIKQ